MRVKELMEYGGWVHVKCFHCGSHIERGGVWQGAGQEVAICRDYECTRAAMHLAYDSIMDVTEDCGESLRIWNELVIQVTREKEGGK